MLREIKNIQQVAGEASRRWFAGDQMELVVHYDEKAAITSFEIIYRYGHGKKDLALKWTKGAGFEHMSVDDGENRPGRHKMTPIYLANGPFNRNAIARIFKKKSTEIEGSIRDFVLDTLEKNNE